jgi:mannose-6-phosphate isomerase-like protein (cupin superfamily)
MLWSKKRKWGWYLTLFRCPWFCVKILKFETGLSLSKQKHFHRNEWWFILYGRGIFNEEIDERTLFNHILIPKNTIHYFKAFQPTYILEVQYGDKVCEEDIKRYK